MRKLGVVAAAVWICSWACAGGDAQDSSDSSEARISRRPEPSGSGSSAPARLAEGADAKVLGGGEAPVTTEGSNTNWRPLEPWLDRSQRPPAREHTDPRKPSENPPGNLDQTADPNDPGTSSGQEGESSSPGSSSSSNDSTPDPG